MPTQNADTSRAWLQGAFKQVLGLSPLDLRRMGTPEELPIERAKQIFEQLEGRAVRLPEHRLRGALESRFRNELEDARCLFLKLEPLTKPDSESEIDALRGVIDAELSDLIDAFSADDPTLGLDLLFASTKKNLKEFVRVAGLETQNVITESDAQQLNLLAELQSKIDCVERAWSKSQEEPDSARDLVRILHAADCVSDDVDKIWDKLDEAGFDRECLKLVTLPFEDLYDPAKRLANVYAVIDALGTNARRVRTLVEVSGTVAASTIESIAENTRELVGRILGLSLGQGDGSEEIDPKRAEEIFQQAMDRRWIQQKGGRYYAGRQEVYPGTLGKQKVIAQLRKDPDRWRHVVERPRRKRAAEKSEKPFFLQEGLEPVVKLLKGIQSTMKQIEEIAEEIAARRG